MMHEFFYVMKIVGFVLVAVTLLVMPWNGRPMERLSRKRYDARMRMTLWFLLPGVALSVIGVFSQFSSTVIIGSLLIAIGGWFFYRLYQIAVGNAPSVNVLASAFALVFGTLGVGGGIAIIVIHVSG